MKVLYAKLKIIIPILLATTIVLTSISVVFFEFIRNNDSLPADAPSDIGYVSSDVTDPGEFVPVLGSYSKNKPTKLKSVKVTPGVDFLTDEVSLDELLSEINSIIDSITADKFNAINIVVNTADHFLFKADGFSQEYSNVLDLIYNIAKSKNITVITTVDLGLLADNHIADKQDIEKIKGIITSESLLSFTDMLIFDGFGIEEENILNDETDTSLYESTSDYCTAVLSDAIKQYYISVLTENQSLYVGISADDYNIILNEETNEYELEYNGHADIDTWAKEHYTDFIFVSAPFSNQDEPNFENVIKLWLNNFSETTDLYFEIAYSKMGSNGWKKTDIIVEQLMTLSKNSNMYFGFDSYISFKNDNTECRTAVIKYLTGDITGQYIFNELAVNEPTKTTFKTNEKTVMLLGASDPEFVLTLNGEELARNELGHFSVDLSLQPGENIFVLEHKGETKTYKITYEKVIFKSVEPTATQKLESGSTLVVNAVSLAGSTVTATLNGTVITLFESAIYDDLGNASEYSNYTGRFVLPTVYDNDINLGAITFKSVSSFGNETKSGSKVTVLKAETPPPETESEPESVTSSEQSDTTSSSSSSENVPSDPSSSSESSSQASSSDTTTSSDSEAKPSVPTGGLYVDVGTSLIGEIVVESAETFDSDANGDYSVPTNNYLPKGTVDYCSTAITSVGSVKMRTLRYGKMVYTTTKGAENLKTYTGTLPDHNEISIASFSNGDRYTTLTLDCLWKAPFLFEIKEQEYNYECDKSGNRDYTITSATYTYIDITFAYATVADGEIDLTDNPVFSKAVWIDNGYDHVLRLYLRKTGVFYGWSCTYNDDGQLVFSFLNPVKITAGANNEYGYSLKGVTVVVDAGHGGNDPGTSGTIPGYYEADLNLMLAIKVKNELESMGATVVMTRTEDTSLSDSDRISIARSADPDLILSIHRNASTSSTPSAFNAYHFNAFSSSATNLIYDATAAEELYTVTKWSGVKWHYFYMCRITDCPVVLTENGFMTNAEENAKLIDPEFNDMCAEALARGVLNYFISIQ